MNEHNNLLDVIQQHQLAAISIALLAYVLTFNRKNTFTITVVLYIVFCLIHQVVEPIFLGASDFTGHKKATAVAWYLGFALTDFLYIFAVYFVHDKIAIKSGWFTRFILGGVLVLGLIQVLGYMDRVVLETNGLDTLYMVSIPSINLSVTIAVCLFSFASITVQGYRASRSNKKWW